MQSYSTQNIKHHRNIIVLMSTIPLLVMVLVTGVFFQENRNNSAKAALIFSTGFENGSLSEWSGGQCMRTYSCTVSTNAPRSGTYSSRYEIRDGDCPVTGDQCYGERAEKQGGTIGSNMSSSEGQNRWYSWSMKLEDGFPNSTRWQVISQWHSANNGSPAVAYYISGRSMYMQHYDPNVGYVQHWYSPTLSTGQWIDLKMNIYWTSSTSGYVRLWINGQEQSRYNGATLRAGEGTYFKQGYYRDQAVSGTGIVYYDNLKAATSEADLGGTTSPPPPAPAPPPPPPTSPPPTPNPAPSGQSPYGGTAQSLPGKVEAENYDNGGEGVAYHDTSSTNVTGKYRNDGVDIENATGGGYNVGYNDPGEWREHTVNLQNGTYTISARVGSAVDGGQLVVKLGGATIATIPVPNTGGWQTYQNAVSGSVTIQGGNDKLLRFETMGNSYTIDSVTFTKQGSETTPSPAPQPSPSPNPTPNPTTPPPPPIIIPGAGNSDPIDIPDEVPVEQDGTIIGDFNGDGLNDVVKDSNNDGKIDPNTEVVVNGSDDSSLTNTAIKPISVEEYVQNVKESPVDSGVVILNVGPLPEVKLAKPVAYTFLIAQGIAITGISSYLAITKLAIFAGIRSKWGL